MIVRCCAEADIEYECGRCGSSMDSAPCGFCDGCGIPPDPNCDACYGTGTVFSCMSTKEWCETMPAPGRENEPRHSIDAFFVCRRHGVTSS